jgi:hypothetical protein
MDDVFTGVVISAVMRVREASHPVARLNIEPDTVAFPEHHGRRPDFDLDAGDLAGLQPFAFQVRVIRTVGLREFLILYAMRSASKTIRS